MRFHVLALLSFVAVAATPLHAEETWYEGSLVLKSQTVLKGEIAIKADYNVVLFRIGEELVVYPAYKVSSVDVYDGQLEANRRFVSLQHGVGAATVYRLYEVLLWGEVSVLRWQHTFWRSIHVDIEEFDYFVLHNDQIIPLQQFRRKTFPRLLRASDGSLKSYMKENNLSINRLEEAIEILAFYNQQQVSSDPLAKN